MNEVRSRCSAGDVLGVHKDGLVVHSIRVLRNGGELDIMLFLGNFWIHKQVQLVVRTIMVSVV